MERAREGERERPSSARARRARAPVERALRACVTVAEEDDVPSSDQAACVAMVVARGTCALRRRTSPRASVVRALRAPCAEAKSALSAHESVKPASAPSQACRAASRAGPGLRAELGARDGERARVKPASCTEPGVPSIAPTAAGRGFLARGTCLWR